MSFNKDAVIRKFALAFILAGIGLPTSLFAVDKPRGVFSSSGARGNEIYANPTLRGVLIRVSWSEVEPTPGTYDFALIDAQVAKAESYGVRWSLGIPGGGVGSPNWLIDQLGAPYVDYTFRGVAGYRLPLFWDSIVQERLHLLADALGARYGMSDSLALVYVTQMTSNGLEGHLQGVSMSTFVSAGYTDAKWVEAAKQATRSFAAAFLQKPIAFEVHEVNGGAAVPTQIMEDLWAEPGLEHRVGAGMWWLSGSTTYQPELIAALAAFQGDIYAQVIGNSGETTRFPNGDYHAIFEQARTVGIRYIEPWEWEFKTGVNSANGAWNAVMQEFNTWSDAQFPASNGITGQLGPPRLRSDGETPVLDWLSIQGEDYLVQRSTNLQTWETLESITAPSSDWQEYADVDQPEEGPAFYRLKFQFPH